MLIKWSSTARLDDYFTVNALKRQIALVDKCNQTENSARNRDLTFALVKEVNELSDTLKAFGLFSDSSRDLKKRIELMKRIREEMGDVFLAALRVSNALNVDVSRSVQEKIYPALRKIDEPFNRKSVKAAVEV